MAGYDVAALKAEAERMSAVNETAPGEETIGQRIATTHKQLEALAHEIGTVEEKLAAILRPESTRINGDMITGDRIGDGNLSPIRKELDMIGDRIMQLRRRLQDIFERIEL